MRAGLDDTPIKLAEEGVYSPEVTEHVRSIKRSELESLGKANQFPKFLTQILIKKNNHNLWEANIKSSDVIKNNNTCAPAASRDTEGLVTAQAVRSDSGSR